MRIGIITQAYFPIHGGVTEHVHHTAIELEKRGHEVTIITANFNREDKKYDSHRVRRIGFDVTLPSNGAFCNVTFGFRLGEQLRDLEREKKFDLVHIHSPVDPILPLIATKTIQAPKIGTFHTYMDSSLGFEISQHFTMKIFQRLSGRIAVSVAARDFFNKYYPADYRIIPNGVDMERFSTNVAKLEKYQDGMLNILFVGRLDPRKGLKYLLKAMPIVAAAVPKARLIIVGGGALREYYRTFVTDEIRDRVIFEGFVPGAILPSYFATADLFIAPATQGESFGIVLLEAMASGIPIVASNITGYNTVLNDGQEGYLVPKENPLRLAEKIIELLRDSELRKKLGTQGVETAGQYSWPKVTNRIEAYYHEVLGK
jgi:phosphatidylinositol alpha-mannosyltransferase